MTQNQVLPLTFLYVEDETAIREAVSLFLATLCQQLYCAADGKTALELVRRHRPHLVITDIRMPVMDGLELAAVLSWECPEIPVIFTTAFSETNYLLKAIELGAAGFVQKPIKYKDLENTLRKAAVPQVQRVEIERLKNNQGDSLASLLGRVPCLEALLDKIIFAIDHANPLIIEGEKGTGKLSLARLIHSRGERVNRPCIVVKCNELKPGKLEEELVGTPHRVTGQLSAAAGGTLILSGIDEMPRKLQSELAAILGRGDFVFNGMNPGNRIPARVIATAHSGAKNGANSLDSTLRAVIGEQIISMPQLCCYGKEGIAEYAHRFLADAAEAYHMNVPLIESESMKLLFKHQWPGNLWELRWVMRNALLQKRPRIDSAALAALLCRFKQHDVAPPARTPPSLVLDDLEEWAVREALARTGGMKMQAAELMGIDYKRFKRKLARYNIS